ncbi:MAG: 3-dehydroquinate synthase [Sphaerochaetaceae bacterium]
MQTLFTCSLNHSSTTVTQIDSINQVHSQCQKLGSRALWICDEHTRLLLPPDVNSVVLAPGEQHKGWAAVETILQTALELNLGRDSLLIALGGGVVCDVAAFAASIYMRGCRLWLIPTTLLAMVDASLGGKTGIDLFSAKNIVGTFYPAETVFIAVSALTSLSDAEFHNGLAEVLKHALLTADQRLFVLLTKQKEQILNRNAQPLLEMISLSLEVKKHYIEADPRETKGVRQALNLGHTFAHALEGMGKMVRFSHGQAVGWGTQKALEAGLMLNITDAEFAQKALALFASYSFERHIEIDDPELFMHILSFDKKRAGSQVIFTLLKDQGEPIFSAIAESLLHSLIVQ